MALVVVVVVGSSGWRGRAAAEGRLGALASSGRGELWPLCLAAVGRLPPLAAVGPSLAARRLLTSSMSKRERVVEPLLRVRRRKTTAGGWCGKRARGEGWRARREGGGREEESGGEDEWERGRRSRRGARTRVEESMWAVLVLVLAAVRC